MMSSEHFAPRPMHPLLHPVSLVALLMLVVNDHILKGVFSNAFTGKLSDFAGLVFLPLLVSTVLTLGDRHVSKQVVVGSTVAIGVLFAGINTIPAMESWYEQTLGLIQMPFRFLLGWGTGRVELTRDPSDLIALLAMPFPWLVAKRCMALSPVVTTHQGVSDPVMPPVEAAN